MPIPIISPEDAQKLGNFLHELLWDPQGEAPYPPYIALYANQDDFLNPQNGGKTIFSYLPPDDQSDFRQLASFIIYNAFVWNYSFGVTRAFADIDSEGNLKNDIHLTHWHHGDGRVFHTPVSLLAEDTIIKAERLQLTFNSDKSLLAETAPPVVMPFTDIVHITTKLTPRDAGTPIISSSQSSSNPITIDSGTNFELFNYDQPLMLFVDGSGFILVEDIENSHHKLLTLSMTFLTPKPSVLDTHPSRSTDA
jgi:hypothetical protein